MADDLIDRLRVAARNRAAAERTITDVTHGKTYESTPAEKTLDWEAADTIAARDEEIRLLREALERIGSMEAFVSSRMIDKRRDEELLARIHYARAALTPPTA